MITPEDCQFLLTPHGPLEAQAAQTLSEIGFARPAEAVRRLQGLCETESERNRLSQVLPTMLYALNEAADPDSSLLNLERFILAVGNRQELFNELATRPRAVEILVKLFVGSQYLTEILIRNPGYLSNLTHHKRLAEFKSRNEFIEQGRQFSRGSKTFLDDINSMRQFQQAELLRIAACDTFGLMDLKTATLQISLLADALIQLGIEISSQDENLDLDQFAVLAFGKLGGEELNYSSDIDLVFVCHDASPRYLRFAQKLIRSLSEATSLGFLYRVDMRLRPWGSAGSLVTTPETYRSYLAKHAGLWEKQALLKARPVAGNIQLGQETLRELEPEIFHISPDELRRSLLEIREKIERRPNQTGKQWGDVKTGPGGIRDIEFLTQYLQLIYGQEYPSLRSRNTLDGLVRLADADLLTSEEYRRLSNGYIVMRTIEHSLQLMHNKQEHSLPRQPRALGYLARRLDFMDATAFVAHFNQHTRTVRRIFLRHLNPGQDGLDDTHQVTPPDPAISTSYTAAAYRELFTAEELKRHVDLLDSVDDQHPAALQVVALADSRWKLTIAGYDMLGDLSMICGLLFAYGFDIESGFAFTGKDVGDAAKFVNLFHIRARDSSRAINENLWDQYTEELQELMRQGRTGSMADWQGRLVLRVAAVFDGLPEQLLTLLPVEIDIDNSASADSTVLTLRGEDTPGFLYELTNALTSLGVSTVRMAVRSQRNRVIDTFHVVNSQGQKIADQEHLHSLRAAIVLIKHFTHLLPRSPNPQSAMLHFQEFLEQQLAQPDWVQQLSSLQDSRVLDALARLLGISDFLWDDFLKMQHQNLFPVVTDLQALQEPIGKMELRQALEDSLQKHPESDQFSELNSFKDRMMLRVDMRHILGLQETFGMFSQELTDLAEVVVEKAVALCHQELAAEFGNPMLGAARKSRLAICGLGKFGGQELGFASDIELMFIYDADGSTQGPVVIPNLDFYHKLVDRFRKVIESKRKGIFEVDLRLRPYGNAGSLAVSLVSFEKYFGPEGPAWPYERQALVKLRPIAGDPDFCTTIQQLRDSLIYRGEPFDVAAMRAIRERQVRQLIRPGTFHAKLSPGGLVDCEYLVQGLQISFGHMSPALRHPNTRAAMKALEEQGILSREDRRHLRDAYRFLRRLIDALRIVRGDASDLTVPHYGSDQFEFLARRLGYSANSRQLKADLDSASVKVLELNRLLDKLCEPW